jgi:hypothetical protein
MAQIVLEKSAKNDSHLEWKKLTCQLHFPNDRSRPCGNESIANVPSSAAELGVC